MTLRQFTERHNSLMGDYMYYMSRVDKAKCKYAKRDLLMGFYLWQVHHYTKKSMRCIREQKKLERQYFKEHFNYKLGA